MKTTILIHAFLAALFCHAQSAFQNLNFEQANPVAVQGNYVGAVTAASALPHWTVTFGGVQQTQIQYNDYFTGSTGVTLVSANNPLGGWAAIDGNYSVLLQGGLTAPDASISQTGVIPAGTQSLLFEAEAGLGTLDVSINGQNIPFTAIGSGTKYILYGANISAYAGDAEQLEFSALEGEGGANNWNIDDISFSSNAIPSAVPEPSPLLLTGIGGVILTVRKWFARR